MDEDIRRHFQNIVQESKALCQKSEVLMAGAKDMIETSKASREMLLTLCDQIKTRLSESRREIERIKQLVDK